MKIKFHAVFLLLTGTITDGSAQSESANRFALVIGVQNYTGVPPLRHSLNDASDMAAALKSKGFKVEALYDPKSKKEIKDAITRYYNIMSNETGAVGIIYYAGHGTQYEGENYLIPATADLQIPGDMDEQCVRMNTFMSILNSSNSNLNILLLDACRTNTFPSFSRDIVKGLRPVEAPTGSIVVFATQPGTVASDGTGKNGLFTSKLLKYINEPNLNIDAVLKKVKHDVYSESDGKQTPSVVDNSIGGDFYFTGGTRKTEIEIMNGPGEKQKKDREPIIILPEDKKTLKGDGQSPAILDTFDDNRHSWWEGESNGGSQHIRNGKLHIDFPEKGWLISINPFVVFERDFRVQASIRQISGVNDNGVGLLWGYNKKVSDENYFIVSANGYYYIGDNEVDKTTVKKGVREWVKSDLIKPLGEVNVLAVEQQSGTLSFYINNEKVFSTSMFRWPGKEIGIATFVKMNVEVDDFSFHQEGIAINLPSNLSKGLVKENLGPNINTKADDLTPIISEDGRTLYFGREYYEGNLGGTADGEDFYSSTFNGTEWSKAENMGSPINSEKVNNILAVSTDNNSLLFADATNFWVRRRSESGWAEPEKFGTTFTNTAKYFESSLSADGKAILFTAKNSSNLSNLDPDERDIYVSTQDRFGVWSPPVNLGPDVNTDADELSPFMAADGRTLYFASTGRPGYGGSDIFVTKRLGDGWTKWSEPENLGPEINTSSFDAYYVLSAAGDYAYMVSDLNGFGKADLVRIKLSKEMKPDPVVLVLGKTLDAKTRAPISADVLIDNLNSRHEVGQAISNPKTGEYRIVLPFGVNYGLHAAAPGYISVNESLELVRITQYMEMEKDLYLVPIREGETIQLNNVFFEQAKPILKPESYPELDRLVAIMNEYPTLEIELGGHTDNIGSPASLIALSLDRVGTVKKYMVEEGIASRRITGKGYGPNSPLVKNDTEEHRKMNRRVEFKIVKK